MQPKRGDNSVNKRGSLALVGIFLAVVIVLTTSLYFSTKFETQSSSQNSLIGAAISSPGTIEIERINGQCNISITESVYNLGHDYYCDSATYGFSIDTSNVTFDCQNHTINCVGNCSYSKD